MPKYRRLNTPLATPGDTIGGTMKSHIVHAHHYRSESNKKIETPEVDRFFVLFYAGSIMLAMALFSWVCWIASWYVASVIFGFASAFWLKLILIGGKE